VDAILLAGAVELPAGSVFHLVDPNGIRQRDYVDLVKRSGRSVRAAYVPAWLLKTAGFGVELLGKLLKLSVPLTPYRVQSITPLWPCDCTKAHTVLGWKPRYSVEEGMDTTFPEQQP
jgi:nucleoside-diphosphate-sugar epimerase